MSRIGKLPITILDGVTITVSDNNLVTVKGAKGTLEYLVPAVIGVKVEGGVCNITRANEEKHTKQLHGTVRANIANMVTGVSKGFKKELIMKGTGYHAELKGKELVIYAGYSHNVPMAIPNGINVTVGGNNNTSITVEGYDKQVVGQFAALIREIRLPEPYKGKGIAYTTEHIRRKEGKKAAKK